MKHPFRAITATIAAGAITGSLLGAEIQKITINEPQKIMYVDPDALRETAVERAVEQKYHINVTGDDRPERVAVLGGELDDLSQLMDNFPAYMKPVREIELGAQVHGRNYAGFAHRNFVEMYSDSELSLAHELVHEYHLYGMAGRDAFEKEWQLCVGTEYGSLIVYNDWFPVWKDGFADARDGFMSSYGSTTLKEDVATFVEELVRIKRSASAETNASVARKFTKDPRYAMKLDVLRKYDFISQKEYDFFGPLFHR